MNVMNYAIHDIITVDPSDSIDLAIAQMEECGIHHVLVMSGKRPVGMVTDRDILISTGWMSVSERQIRRANAGAPQVAGPTRVEQIMSRGLISINMASTAREAATIMLERKIGALPVLHDDNVVGIVTETELVSWFGEFAYADTAASRFLQQTASDLSPERVISVDPLVPLEDVVDIFRRFRIRHVPVTAADRTLVGMISDRDVRRAMGWASIRDMQAEAEGRMPDVEAPSKACDVMQRSVRTIAPSTSLLIALRRMLDQRIHSLVMVEDGTLAGILTLTDFTRVIAYEEFM